MLIAVALLGFILISIAPLFIASVKSNYSANEYTSVNMLARDRLEQLMNLRFDDPELNPGIYANDQSGFLPDPTDPTKLSTVFNPLTVTYQVTQWQNPDPLPATGSAFVPVRVTLAGQVLLYKRIDVTVMAHQSGPASVGTSGIGLRVARVSGFVQNPSPPKEVPQPPPVPTPAGVIYSVADGCSLGGNPPCP